MKYCKGCNKGFYETIFYDDVNIFIYNDYCCDVCYNI